MNFHDRKVIPPKYIYLFMTVICIIMLLLSIVFESRFSFLKSITGTIVTPMQTGVNAAGSSLYLGVKNSKEKKALMKQNKELEAKLAEYKAKEKTYEQEKYELKRLQELLELKEQYVEYNTIGARVIATDSTNWFYTFIIDKGEEDGIKVGCNVLADGGLAGIVTEVGNGYSKVRSIIDDNSNVSASISGTDSLCTISGDISAMKKGYIHINYIDKADVIEEGAEIVTSHVSNKFLPGILIGYVSDVEMDSNNLTQSAKCIPVVDFSNLSEVLVITDLKKTYRTNSKSKNIYDSVTSPDTQVPEETSEEYETTTEADDDNDTEATTQEEQAGDSSEETREDAVVPDDQNEREEQH
ncbi:MAG: rod shape-determining protein MreC [Lachnospiraceae bacterium]|nr:rod shape-determining protein MreC [Lachnospiraceae bacterium]